MDVDRFAEDVLVEGSGEEGFDEEAVEEGFADYATHKAEILEVIFVEEGTGILGKLERLRRKEEEEE